MNALRECDVCILVTQCGRSAHLELGYAIGSGKKSIILALNGQEAELMYLMDDKIVFNADELLNELKMMILLGN
jgi:hypothetical protein